MRVAGGPPPLLCATNGHLVPLLRVPKTPAAVCSHLPHADGAGANQAVCDSYQLRRVVWDAAWQGSGQARTTGHAQACGSIAGRAVANTPSQEIPPQQLHPRLVSSFSLSSFLKRRPAPNSQAVA